MKRYILVGVTEDIGPGYIQRLLDDTEADFLYGTMRDVDPVGVMEVQRMLDALGPVKPAHHCNIEPARRQGKGERKRNRKHRWG